MYRAYASTVLSVLHLHLLGLVPYFATRSAPFARIRESEPSITQWMSLQMLHIGKVPIRSAFDTSESSLPQIWHHNLSVVVVFESERAILQKLAEDLESPNICMIKQFRKWKIVTSNQFYLPILDSWPIRKSKEWKYKFPKN